MGVGLAQSTLSCYPEATAFSMAGSTLCISICIPFTWNATVLCSNFLQTQTFLFSSLKKAYETREVNKPGQG